MDALKPKPICFHSLSDLTKTKLAIATSDDNGRQNDNLYKGSLKIPHIVLGYFSTFAIRSFQFEAFCDHFLENMFYHFHAVVALRPSGAVALS